MHRAEITFYSASGNYQEYESEFNTVSACIEWLENMLNGKPTARAWINGKEVIIHNGTVHIDDGKRVRIILTKPYLGALPGKKLSLHTLAAAVAVEGGIARYDDEKSKAYVLACALLNKVKICTDSLMWITGYEKENTSDAIHIRWLKLKNCFTIIRLVPDAQFPHIMAGIEDELAKEVKSTDRTNVRFGEDDDPQIWFQVHIEDYANIIIEALKKEMAPGEPDHFEENAR